MEELIEDLYKKLDCNHIITKKFIKALLESVKKFDHKQDIYETDNISNTGEIGLLTRIGDSFYEIRKYLEISEEKRSELQLTKDKILKDYMNIGVYGVIGYLYSKGEWE